MDLESVSNRIGSAFESRAANRARQLKSIRTGVLIGSLLLGVGSISASIADGIVGFSHVVAIIGAVLGFVFGWLLLSGEEPADALEEARKLLYELQEREKVDIYIQQDIEDFELVARRLKSLFLAYHGARPVLETLAVSKGRIDENSAVELCLSAIRQDLVIAAGFDVDTVWTICVYRYEAAALDGAGALVLAAHERSISCDKKEARPWRVGVGAAGVSFAKNAEVVVPDTADESAGNAFVLQADNSRQNGRPTDPQRYRSLLAVPIRVQTRVEPWGVVVLSSDVAGHFGAREEVHQHIQRKEEAGRVLAGIVALVVAMYNEPESDPSLKTS